ncbi:putative trans-sulfuration enzyme [Trichoderma ghanense]|uniref:Trans-sulfuration enzyme n=1 Tax=Trichoderma ghanense TaxID=65468 RepID=A0ABY2GZF8_9HYPO
MSLHLETLALHVDNKLDVSNDVAPPLHPSSTFRFPSDPEQLVPLRLRRVGDTYYADKAHSRGAILVVDATFGPPGLQDPFKHGADIVLHSGTKYLGGHSDMLCGRFFLGGVMGSLEGWLGVRNMRTLHLRVIRQSESATKLVQWLNSGLQRNGAHGVSAKSESQIIRAALSSVTHASLQTADLERGWLQAQMPNGFGPVFESCMTSRDMANRLPSKLKLFAHCTSLGGVESMIEWGTMTDPYADPTLLRVSIGVENWEHLKSDILQALQAVLDDEKIKQ